MTSFYSETSCFVPIKGAEYGFTSILQALLCSICFHSPSSSAVLCNMSSAILDLCNLSLWTCVHVVSFFLFIFFVAHVAPSFNKLRWVTHLSLVCLSCVNYLYRLETHIYSILIYTPTVQWPNFPRGIIKVSSFTPQSFLFPFIPPWCRSVQTKQACHYARFLFQFRL